MDLQADKNSKTERIYLAVDFTVTLKRVTQFGGFAESGDKVYRYFFSVPQSWKDLDYKKLVRQTADEIYRDLKLKLQTAEPFDPNYIALKKTETTILTDSEVSAKPWLRVDPPVWHATVCVKVYRNGRYRMFAKEEF